MAEIKTELSFLDEAFMELEQADHAIAMHNLFQPQRRTIEFDQHQLDKRKLNERREGAVSAIYRQSEAQDDTQLSAAHKFMILDVIDDTGKPTAEGSKRHIRESFRMYDRVCDNVEGKRGIVAVLGYDAMSLFESHGAEDIAMDRDGVALQLKDGYQVKMQSPLHKNFPDVVPTPATHAFNLLPRYGAGYPTNRMQYFDPASDKFRPHFDTLDLVGEPKGPQLFWLGRNGEQGERPAEAMGDAERYAFRLAQSKLPNAAWLELPYPSDTLRERVAMEFARVYSDVLCGHKPWDIEPQLHVRYGGFSGDEVSMRQTRERSLAQYNADERNNVFYASGTNVGEVEAATRENIERLASSGNAIDVAGALHAAQIIDAFFERI